jgi:hypothetical protein
MTSAEMRSAVQSVKRKESRHAPRSSRKTPRRPVGVSDYEEGVQMAGSAVELYRKALKKMK